MLLIIYYLFKRIIESNEKRESKPNVKTALLIDLSSKADYFYFMNQIKELGMTHARFHFVLVYLVGLIPTHLSHLNLNNNII